MLIIKVIRVIAANVFIHRLVVVLIFLAFIYAIYIGNASTQHLQKLTDFLDAKQASIRITGVSQHPAVSVAFAQYLYGFYFSHGVD